MSIAALNLKPSNCGGSIIGFFDMRYHGLTVRGCRLMAGNGGGIWIAFPQRSQTEQDGGTKWFDIVELTRAEMDHVRRVVIDDLAAQGHTAQPPGNSPKCRGKEQPTQRQSHYVTPEGEDLSQHYTDPADGDDIPF